VTVATDLMRAATLRAPGDAQIVEVALPEAGEGEVRVRLEGCGVCASNLEVWGGQPWFDYPLEAGAPGHEAWGRVDQVGAGVHGLREGDRVAMLSGRAYAEYDVARAGEVLPLPAELDGTPVPAEPLGCAVNIFRRSRIAAGQTVAIVGVGFLGAVLCRLAADAGARVIGIGRRPWALDVARGMGAEETIAMADRREVVERVASLTGGVLCDRVIEATGRQDPLELAAELTRERGTLVIAGYHQDGPRQVDMQLWNWRGLDVVNAHERAAAVYLDGMREAVAMLARGAFDLSLLLTHRFPLDRLGDALDATRDRPDGFMKAWVAP
jgi:threonine dehydrogenase-like Zn-dependent dehydrogenase